MSSILSLLLLFAGATHSPSPFDLSLDATPSVIAAKLGPPDHVREEKTFRIWDYNLGAADENDMGFAWTFFFDGKGELLSITHNAGGGETASRFFGDLTWQRASSPAPGSLPVVFARSGDDQVALAIGISNAGQPCNQLILIRRSALERFYPWLREKLN